MKPSIAKGTRDFLPGEIKKRNYIFNTIKEVFKRYGFAEIETPSMENLETLSGKYGEEGDRLLFKILNNGDYLAKADELALVNRDSKKLISSISKRGLRYDLTVPFARYVVMHQHEIQFPFKRYQIQPVWRADRPQKGRYQEFYQCDADMVGSNSLMYEAELIKITDEIFTALKIKVDIKLNNRKILYGMAEFIGVEDRFTAFTVAVDKLDKIGIDKILVELENSGFNKDEIEKTNEILLIKGLEELAYKLSDSVQGKEGIREVKVVLKYLENVKINNQLLVDPCLARGLSYYTGCIFEVKSRDFQMGSIAGGGRYDDLTSTFGLKAVSGVGISYGAERIYDIMNSASLFPADLARDIDIMVLTMDEETHLYGFNVVNILRERGIKADIYPDPVKMKKQMKYANARNVPYVLIIGSQEQESKLFSLKNLLSGEQESISLDALINKLHN